jgi:hypothetical protein
MKRLCKTIWQPASARTVGCPLRGFAALTILKTRSNIPTEDPNITYEVDYERYPAQILIL